MVVQTSDDTNISNNNAPSELIFCRENIEALCGAAIWGSDLIIFFQRLKVAPFQNHSFFPSIRPKYVKALKAFQMVILVFCYQNCSDLLWEKIVQMIKKNIWNLRLEAENLQEVWDHLNNLFKQWKVEQYLVTECFFNLFLEVSWI